MSYHYGQGGVRLPDDDIENDVTLPSGVGGANLSSGSGLSPYSIAGQASGAPPGTVRVNKYETSMPLRLDIAAALAYALGPVTGILFLIFETKNDYVRFHSWQSALVFVSIMAVHAFLGLFSSTMAWLIFGLEITLALWLGYQAYVNSDTLARYQVPYFGPLASTWVDAE
ncbi:hypothetical protein BATDEDRAFT_89137 [Batrachochytrium dendrobatidis JAM81]|uniref:Uncharacterized protein n=1 Tax=Batrachochytrium dendrobatidis (strain JAM81 / FGSC 10211) TaxID=684364 RepID=F4P487_BATDJ|nr:uncharacterized protein BATDEDRAFT_89137 [Batrachochytrium dendrobatidis JAM81]EGF79743.1 hypothetical protein BATDEDRAFT_89137 [Batrachochytrium dendrobatidis JAM81]|eukprot:XP_006679664.1 hypothetical protein BATDEDRAFT_89137 [Batrachochytrium dendrobatidis JAM81]